MSLKTLTQKLKENCTYETWTTYRLYRTKEGVECPANVAEKCCLLGWINKISDNANEFAEIYSYVKNKLRVISLASWNDKQKWTAVEKLINEIMNEVENLNR